MPGGKKRENIKVISEFHNTRMGSDPPNACISPAGEMADTKDAM